VNESSQVASSHLQDCQARLKAKVFEQLQVLKAAWCDQIVDLAKLNADQTEEHVLDEFKDMFLVDEELRDWDHEVLSYED
jgi:hypothetical protein